MKRTIIFSLVALVAVFALVTPATVKAQSCSAGDVGVYYWGGTI